MGHSSRTSTGCKQCRNRKVKCDETRPGCRKCAQIRHPCPGYPHAIELRFRSDAVSQPGLPQFQRRDSSSSHPTVSSSSDDTQISELPQLERYDSTLSDASMKSASTVVKARDSAMVKPYGLTHPKVFDPQAPREYTPLLGIKDESDRKQELLAVPVHRRRSITPPPKYDVQHQATCFFLNLFSYQPSKVYGIPILDFLPDMLSSAKQHSAVQLASEAVSRMALADRYSGRDARLETSGKYAKALKSVSKMVSSEAEAMKDEAVTAVWLLGLYEAVNSVLSHQRCDNKRQSFDEEWKGHIAHIRGAMRLLRLRGTKQFDNPRSEKIFRIFKAAIQMRLFILNSATSTDFAGLEIDCYKDEHEFVPSKTASKASSFFRRTARHLEAAKNAIQKFELQTDSWDLAAELDQLLYEGECLDAGMLRWSKQEPGWDMMPVQANIGSSVWALYPSHAQYYFYSFWVYLYWLRFLIARVKLYETLIEIVKIKQRVKASTDKEKHRHSDTRIASFTKIVQNTADQLIGLTAYALGDMTNTGHFLSSPTGLNPGGGWQEVNVVAAMQLVVPFKVLQRSLYVLPGQEGAIDLAIAALADGFRRQPVNPI